MLRKLLMVAAVAIIPIGAVMATGSVAGAAAAETGTATCGALTGTISFSTPISNAGKSLAAGATFTQTSTVKATLTKCVRAGGGITLTKGAVAGTIKQVTKNTTTKPIKVATCTGLEGTSNITGKLTTTWTASKAIAPSVSNFTNEKGATASVSGKVYGSFTLPATAAGVKAGTGSFLGTNTGKTDKANARTVDTVAQLTVACQKSVKSVSITTWKAPAATYA